MITVIADLSKRAPPWLALWHGGLAQNCVAQDISLTFGFIESKLYNSCIWKYIFWSET